MASNLISKIVSVIFARGLIKFSNLIVFLILSRAIGAEGLGLFGVFSSAILVGAAAGNLGIRQALAFEIGRSQITIPRTHKLVLVILPCLVIFSSAVLYLVLQNSLGDTQVWVFPMILGITGALFTTLNQGAFLGLGRVKDLNRYEVIPRFVMLGGVVILWWLGLLTTQGVFFTFSTGFLVAGVLGSQKLRQIPQIESARQSSDTPIGPTIVHLIKSGWPFAITLSLVMLNSRVSVFLLPQLETTAAAGQFFASIRLNELFLETATAIGLVLFSQGVQEKDSRKAMLEAATVARWLFAFLALIAACAFFLAPIIIVVLFGNEFYTAVPILKIICFGLPFAGLSRILYQAIAAQGMPLIGAAVYLPIVVLNIVLSLILIPQFGVAGGAYTLLATQILICVFFAAILKTKFAISPRQIFLISKNDLAYLPVIRGKIRKKLRPNN